MESCGEDGEDASFFLRSLNVFSLGSTDVSSLSPLSIKKRFDFKQLIFNRVSFLRQHFYPGLEVWQMTAGRDSGKTALIYQIS